VGICLLNYLERGWDINVTDANRGTRHASSTAKRTVGWILSPPSPI